MNEYAITEIWGSKGAPVLAYVKATSGTQAIVTYLIESGYTAREEPNGDLVTSDDAPSLRADLVTERVIGRMAKEGFEYSGHDH
jgi:hypothetical protein